MNKNKNTLNQSHYGSYYLSTAVRSYGFGLSSVDNSETDDNGGAFLLDIRFIRSIENLNREFCRASKLISLSDEGFHSSISQESSTKNHLFAIRAAVTGNISQLLYLIHVLKVSVNSANSQGITLLHWATENDHVAVVRLLLSLGADFRLTTKRGRSVLHTAAYSDAANCLKLFLKIFFEQEKMDIVKRNDCETSYKFIFQRDLNGNSPLHLACRLRSKHCLKILLSFIMKYFGWSIVEEMLQQCNKSNQTPVHVACLWNSIEATNLLLTDNLNKIVNKIYKSRKRNNVAVALREASRRSLFWQIGRGIVLHEMATVKCSYACFTKNSSFLEYDNEFEASELKMHLLDECTSVRCSECDKAQLGVVRVILKCCPELVLLRDALGQTALMCSVINDAISLTKALLVYRRGKERWLNKQLKSVDPDFHTALHHAAARGKLRQAALLVKRGASVKRQDSYGATPMHYAAIHGFCATLRLLYQANKYTDEVRTNNGHSAFMWAAMSGINISIRTMIDANPVVSREDSDHQGCTALHLAAAGDHVEVINTLLLFKWNAEKRNKLGETPLVVATKSGSAKAVRRFVHAGVDHSTQDKLNNTVLHVAVNSDGKKEILRQLLHSLKDSSLLNMRNDMGQTPLHCATKYNAVQCVRYLLKYGADPLIKDNRGWDPLMVAIQQDCWSTIILLLKNSSNINCYSAADNQTTLSLALEKKNYLLASFLETNGAMLASEIRDMAARIIQRWYRARSASQATDIYSLHAST
ncbi:Inversin [Dirofilaria immitis]